jgi:hypothetical protein
LDEFFVDVCESKLRHDETVTLKMNGVEDILDYVTFGDLFM